MIVCELYVGGMFVFVQNIRAFFSAQCWDRRLTRLLDRAMSRWDWFWWSTKII